MLSLFKTLNVDIMIPTYYYQSFKNPSRLKWNRFRCSTSTECTHDSLSHDINIGHVFEIMHTMSKCHLNSDSETNTQITKSASSEPVFTLRSVSVLSAVSPVVLQLALSLLRLPRQVVYLVLAPRIPLQWTLAAGPWLVVVTIIKIL